MGDGPTSARLAVVDYNADTQTLLKPVVWVKENGWFRTPAGEWLPDVEQDPANVTEEEYRQPICSLSMLP